MSTVQQDQEFDRLQASIKPDWELIQEGLTELVRVTGEINEAKGFHDDRPRGDELQSSPEHRAALQQWQGNKLMLVVGEVTEAHEELRDGRATDETYYRADGKPEGVPSEIADVVIRSADVASTEEFDLGGRTVEKLQYNMSRPYKHGKAF